MEQIARNYYAQFAEVVTFSQAPKCEICKVELFPTLCQKVREWAAYAFALIASGGGLFGARPEMPSLSLNRERYRLTAAIEQELSNDFFVIRSNQAYIVSNVAQKLLGLKENSSDLKMFEKQNGQRIYDLLVGDHREKAQLSFEVVVLPSLLDNRQEVDLSALCKATMTVKSSDNRELTIDLMRAKLRAQDAAINLEKQLSVAKAYYQGVLRHNYDNYDISLENGDNLAEIRLIATPKEESSSTELWSKCETRVKMSAVQNGSSIGADDMLFYKYEGWDPNTGARVILDSRQMGAGMEEAFTEMCRLHGCDVPK